MLLANPHLLAGTTTRQGINSYCRGRSALFVAALYVTASLTCLCMCAGHHKAALHPQALPAAARQE